MNLHPYYFRTAIRPEFSQEDFGRLLYFERIYGGIGGVRPGEIEFINYERTVADDNDLIAITYRDDGLIGMNWVRVTYLQPDHPKAKTEFEHAVKLPNEKVG